MPKLIPTLLSPGQPGSGIAIASDDLDRAIANLARPASDAADGYLVAAFNARRRVAASVLPYDLAADMPSSLVAAIAAPTVAADDPVLGQDALDFSPVSAALRLPNTPISPSFTLVLAFYPVTSGATGTLLEGTQDSPSAYARMLDLQGGGVTLWSQYGISAATVAPRSAINETGANILVVSASAADRTVRAWLNARDPVITPAFAPDPWPSVNGAARWRIGGQGTSLGQESNCRISHMALCDVALHKTAEGIARVDRIVNAAARRFGIELD